MDAAGHARRGAQPWPPESTAARPDHGDAADHGALAMIRALVSRLMPGMAGGLHILCPIAR